MAFFSIKDYLTIGELYGIKKVIWQVAEDKDFKNIITESIKTEGDLFSCHMALKKPDGSWYEEDDNIYVRVRIVSETGISSWFIVEPNKAHLISVWLNDNNPKCICDIKKKRICILETDKKGRYVTDFIDEDYMNEKLKEFRRETYRKDY
jgi:hypothetical protein